MVPSVGTEKVAEQHILQKCSKCSRFEAMSTLLKVATIAITHLAMDLGLKNTKQAIFRLYKSATTHLWQPSKSTKKKTHGRTPEKKKNHGSHLVNTCGGHPVSLNQPKKIPRQVFPMTNLSCKFGSYNILRDRKAFVKTWQTDARTHGQRAFYNLPYQAYRPVGDN